MTNTIALPLHQLQSHGEPYDVFLAVCFGFCYCSTLVPIVRMLERKKHGESQVNAVTTMDRSLILLRGLLTILGLGCLYGWYVFYLRAPFDHSPPFERMLLDWVSIGLFAVGANCWDNEMDGSKLYYWVEVVAIAVFGITCGLAVRQHYAIYGDEKPLLRACVVCTALETAFLFGWIVSKLTTLCMRSEASRKKILVLSISALVSCILLFAIAVSVFSLLFQSTTDIWNLRNSFGNEYWLAILAGLLLHLVVGLFAFLIVRKQSFYRGSAILVTILPMLSLIIVTYMSRKQIFPR